MSIADSNNEKSLELKKHINAIHSSNNLTLVQRKLFNALLFNAYHDLPNKQRFHIRYKDLCSLIGYNSKDTRKLKDALLGLITIAIEWNVLDCSTGQEKKWKASSILASAELSNGLCIYEYSEVMKEFFYHPDIYGRIDINLVAKFKSTYGLALYENCIRYRGLNQTPWFPIEVFRKLMGVYDDKYQKYRDFKKRVIDIATKEVNSLSPINVIPQLERINQKVIKLRFKLLERNKLEHTDTLLSQNDIELETILTKTFGFSKPMIKEIIDDYGIDYIKEKINIIVQSDSFINGKIRALSGYLMEALKKDYKQSVSSKQVVQNIRKVKEDNDKAIKENAKKIEEHYKDYITKKMDTFTNSLNKEDKESLIIEFEQYLQDLDNIFLKNLYNKHHLNHPATQSTYNTFIVKNKSHQLGNYLSIEEFTSIFNDVNK